jgi:VCBS repeat-containing protein
MSQVSFDAYNPGSIFSLRSGIGLRVHPVTGRLLGHQGLDWTRQPGAASIAGQSIPAAADGVVVDRGFQLNPTDGTGWGNYVVLEHTRADGTKFQTLYAHLQAPSGLNTGAVVAAGESVGLVGATGGATGPHIHMEVVVSGNARPLTMGGVAGVRINPATFAEWGGLPHMVGTDTSGNQIILQETRNALDGTLVTTLSYRSPNGVLVQSVRLARQPLDDGGGNTIGYELSYADSAGSPQRILTDAVGNVVSRTTFTNLSATTDRNGLTITADPFTGARTLQIDGVSGGILANSAGAFTLITPTGSIAINLKEDPFGGGTVTAGGKEYQFSGSETLSYKNGSIVVDGRGKAGSAVQKVITASGFGLELEFALKQSDMQWVLADAGGSELASDAGFNYGPGNGWMLEGGRLLQDESGSSGPTSSSSELGQFILAGEEYSFTTNVKDIEGAPTGAVVRFERRWDPAGGRFVLTQQEVDARGNVVAEYRGQQATTEAKVRWEFSKVSIRDADGDLGGFWETTYDGTGTTYKRLSETGEALEVARSVVLADGTRVTQSLDASSRVLSEVSTRIFDDGSSISTSRLGGDTVRTISRDSDGNTFRVIDETTAGTLFTRSTYFGSGALIETQRVYRFDDGALEITSRPDGYEMRVTRDGNGVEIGRVEIVSYSQTFTSAISDTTSLIGAIKSKKPLPQLASGLKLLNDLDRQSTIPYLGTASTIAQGALSIYNLANAFENGDALDQLSATGNAIIAVDSALQAVVSTTALAPIVSSIAPALPGLGLINAIKNDDPIGAAMSIGTMIQGSAFLTTNPLGWALLAASFAKALEEPPEAWGIGSFKFGAGTELGFDTQGESFGRDQVRFLMVGNGKVPSLADGSPNPEYFGGLKAYLQETVDRARAANPDVLLGIIPQRMPTLTWREARQDSPGYAIRDIDPVTGQERYPTLRYNDNWLPYNADTTDPEQRYNVFERLVLSALRREAIAPLWEVNTAKMQQAAGDPLAGLTEVERAARRGLGAHLDAATNKLAAGEFKPVALDLDGDGQINVVGREASHRTFDWDGSGFDKSVGWVGAGEGMLMLDRNFNGRADVGRELFSNSLVADVTKGIRALSALDANGDGLISALDPVFSELRLWQDANGNAVSEAVELKTLADLGITELDYGNARFTRNGGIFTMQSQALETSADGLRVAQVSGGLRVEFSDGSATLVATRVIDLGAGNDLVPDLKEDGGEQGDGLSGQLSSRHDPLSIPVAQLLANDQLNGQQGAAAGLRITAAGNASVGRVSIANVAGEDVVLFDAPHHFSGRATFEYTVTAPDGQAATSTVTVDVSPVNDRPDVSYELPDRPIYGWAPRIVQSQVQLPHDGGSTTQTEILPDQGVPIYEPYDTVQGVPVQSYEVVTGESSSYFATRPIGAPRDTGIPISYFQTAVAESPGASAYSFNWNGQPYEVAAQPVLYRHSAPIDHEPANDGRIVVTDADGPVNVRFEIAPGSGASPIYGRLGGEGSADDIDPVTGEFAYTGERYVDIDEAGNVANVNVFTDKHVRGEWTGSASTDWDTFVVKVVDLSDPTGNTYTTKDVTVPHFGPKRLDVQSGGKKPIAIDLDGDGFHFTDVDDSNVFYNVNGDGWRRRIAWNNPADGFIAYDRNGDGKITEFDEISFVPYSPNSPTDLQALKAAFDSNGDGRFDGSDEQWASFGVWQDANTDGVSDPGEFKTMDQLGIQSISLITDGQFQVIDGQSVHGTAVATKIDGSALQVADVTLRYKNETQVTTPDGSTAVVQAPTFQPGSEFDGTMGPDLVLGTSGSDMFRTGDGNDVINDDSGNDGVQAGAGDDLVYTGMDNDVVDGGIGNDQIFAGLGNDLVFGDEGDDFIMLEGGNDVAFGGAGQDFMAGGAGNDAISGDAGDDKLFGEAGWDALYGKDGDDELWGMDGNDMLVGDSGNDLLVGGTGDDQMEGGTGNDTYEVDSEGDLISEVANEGTDTVRSSINYTLAEALENLTLTGLTAIRGTGNSGGNVLVGNDQANRLEGLSGDDLIDGGLAADIMVGGEGNDTYIVDNVNDSVVEVSGQGVDTVRARVSTTLAANVENLTLLGFASIDGTGNDLDNVLLGNAGANMLSGMGGADTMRGGSGNDTYKVDDQDTIAEEVAQGYDTVDYDGNGSYALGANLEALVLGDSDSSGTGNELDNVIRAGTGSHNLYGLDGNDVLDGGAGNDNLYGGAGDDVLLGGADVVEPSYGPWVDLTGVPGLPDGYGPGWTVAMPNGVRDPNGAFFSLPQLRSYLEVGYGFLMPGSEGGALPNDDFLEGGQGDDKLDGGAGFDTYAFSRGDGNDKLFDTRGGGALAFGAGIARDDLSFSVNGTDLVVTLLQSGLPTGDRITLVNWASLTERVGSMSFVDGSQWTLDESVLNRAPTASDDVAAVVEDVAHVVSGNVLANDSDPDAGDTLRVVNPGAHVGQFGSLVLSADGNYVYTLDNTRPDIQSLAAGQAVFERFAVSVADSGRPAKTASSELVLTVTGTNDAPVVAADAATIDEREAAVVTGNVLLNDSDVDQGTTLHVVQSGAQVGRFGTLQVGADGQYDYTLDPSSSALRALADGMRDSEVFTITVADGDDPSAATASTTLSIDVTGRNDGPNVIADAVAVDERVASVVAGNVLLNDSDVDLGTILRVLEPGSQVGQFGTLQLGDDGQFTYELNPASLALRALGDGMRGSEVFSVTVADGAGPNAASVGTTLSIEVTGRNDAPSLVAPLGDLQAKVRRNLVAVIDESTFVDADLGDSLTWSARMADGSELPDWLSFDPSTRRFTGMPARELSGQTYDIEVSVHDRHGVGARDVFRIELNSIGVTIRGTDAGDSLVGTDLDDTIHGQGGDDILDGTEGKDAMAGGLGDDTYLVDNLGDRTLEAAGEGTDTVRASLDWTLAAQVENLVMTGQANLRGTGNESANTLTGNGGSNTLSGLAGNDILDGAAGADTMLGGEGNDTYVVDNDGDKVEELLGQGTDAVRASIDYVLPQHVEQLSLLGNAMRATGNDLDNLLFGNELDNILDGRTGADRMAGGLGDDRYRVDNASDQVIEAAGGGIDTVVSSVSFSISGEVENLLLSGADNVNGAGNTLDNVLVGNVGANIISGGSGNDVVAGGQGNDAMDGGVGNDLYLYNQGDGRDTLNDASGIDTLRFGAGITLDSLSGRTVTISGQNRVMISILGTDGQETAQGIEVALGADGRPVLETLQFADGSTATFDKVMITGRNLSGTWGNDSLQGDRRDDTITADRGNDIVYARWGNDVVYGSSGNDRLYGEGGNDRLYGESDQDQLFGGAGDDLLDGGSADDLLSGGTGRDKLYGGVGNDILDGGAGDDILEGGDGDDGLYAGAGNDALRGGSGSDVLAGGDGDDVIDVGAAGMDVVVAGAGNDRIDAVSIGAAFIDGGMGNDDITAGYGSDFVAAGRGDDQIDGGGGLDIFAFNRGDGADTLNAISMFSATLSLGGGIRYQDFSLRKDGDNLVIGLGQGDSITVAGWYKAADMFGWFHHDDLDFLQVITDGGDYSASSSSRLTNRKVVLFDFAGLVSRFDAARAANPGLGTWTPTAADFDRAYMVGSDSRAMGGDLAWRYATTGSYGDLSAADVKQRLYTLVFSGLPTLTASTAVNPWTALQAGTSLIADATQGLPSPTTPTAAPSGDELTFAALAASGRKPGWLPGVPTPVLP